MWKWKYCLCWRPDCECAGPRWRWDLFCGGSPRWQHSIPIVKKLGKGLEEIILILLWIKIEITLFVGASNPLWKRIWQREAGLRLWNNTLKRFFYKHWAVIHSCANVIDKSCSRICWMKWKRFRIKWRLIWKRCGQYNIVSEYNIGTRYFQRTFQIKIRAIWLKKQQYLKKTELYFIQCWWSFLAGTSGT